MKPPTANEALSASGLTLAELRRKARVSPGYWRQIAREGYAPAATAERLAKALGCSILIFSRPLQGGSTPTGGRAKRATTCGSRRPRHDLNPKEHRDC